VKVIETQKFSRRISGLLRKYR